LAASLVEAGERIRPGTLPSGDVYLMKERVGVLKRSAGLPARAVTLGDWRG
jgi:hypothetical protein